MFRRLILLVLLALAGVVRAEDKPAAAPAPELTPLEKAVNAVKLPKGFRYEVLVMGDIPEPVYLQFSPDGRLWFTGRRGDIWAYGVGGQYFLTDKDGLRAEYTRYASTDTSQADVDSFAVSYVRKF